MKSTEQEDDGCQRQLEILKAVAQAWHGHSGSPRSTNEYDAYRQNFQRKPSRFKLEAMNKSSAKRVESVSWDFKQSLWDSHEIVNVSRRLERELVLEDPFSGVDTQRRRFGSEECCFFRIAKLKPDSYLVLLVTYKCLAADIGKALCKLGYWGAAWRTLGLHDNFEMQA
ncbi:hypothetical protein SADUNF_Sadunf15G0073700 [Salix dunnii]|uniref:Uncharacterized protein n=1 Tax=Salix dunnii TaxID=1413687 RepID=A0A835ML70_9ROSI|nr:hypothetical protein SADUNF_Sadunf15G0073700 [Salix dunnii]